MLLTSHIFKAIRSAPKALRYMSSTLESVVLPEPERIQELEYALADIRARVKNATPEGSVPILVAVSKYKPASDILACYRAGQLVFGENYAQELADKATSLPREIHWHFIGTFQSNKAKLLASIPNLQCIHTLASIKAASSLNKAISDERKDPLCVLIQVNTSCEENKSGLPTVASDADISASDLGKLAAHIIKECPKLQLQGLMTIGALEHSLDAAETEENDDFKALKDTRDKLENYLRGEFKENNWGQDDTHRLILSMGMSSDFEAALKAGSDLVRVGSSIFGHRSKATA